MENKKKSKILNSEIDLSMEFKVGIILGVIMQSLSNRKSGVMKIFLHE